MGTALLVASWALVGATLIAFIKHETWWIRFFDFPRSQFTLLGVVCIGGLIWMWGPGSSLQGTTLAALSLCTAYQAWELSAYTKLRRVQSLPFESDDKRRRVRLLIANVLMTNRNVQQYVTLIQKYSPDIVVFAEPDHYWEEKLRVIEQEYPHTIKCPIENTYGMLMYSRLPLRDPQILFRVEENVPSFSAFVQLRNGDEFEVHTVHPRPPHVGTDTENRDAELVLVARDVKDSPHAVIVTGDLNDVAWSHTTRLFLRLSKLLDPRVGRMFCNTFHAHHPLFRWPLDHLFHSRAFRVVRLHRLEKTDSDHFAVLMELSYEPEVKNEHERPVADGEDLEEAQEMVEKAADEPNTRV